MRDVKITAMLDLAQGDATWEEVGRDLGSYLDAHTMDNDLADVVMTVDYIPEDGDIMIRLPGYMSIWLPRWQLEKAITMAAQKEGR